jgi:hypothetical protein
MDGDYKGFIDGLAAKLGTDTKNLTPEPKILLAIPTRLENMQQWVLIS